MLRGLFWQIMITLIVGGSLSSGLTLSIGWLLGADGVVLMSLAPTSVTTPIWHCDALQEGEECGAFAALAMSLWGVLTALILPLVFAG